MEGLDVVPSRKRGRADYPAFWDKYISALSECHSGGEFDAAPPVDESLASYPVVDLFPPEEAAELAAAQPGPYVDLFPEETLELAASAAASEDALSSEFDALWSQWQRDRAHAQSGGTFGDDDDTEVAVDSESPSNEDVDMWWQTFWEHLGSIPDSEKPGYSGPGHGMFSGRDFDVPAWRAILLREYLKRKRQIDALTGDDFWDSLKKSIAAPDTETGWLELPLGSPLNIDSRSLRQTLNAMLYFFSPKSPVRSRFPLSPSERLSRMREYLRQWIHDQPADLERRMATYRAETVPLPDSDDDDDADDDDNTLTVLERHKEEIAAAMRDDDWFNGEDVAWILLNAKDYGRAPGTTVNDAITALRAQLPPNASFAAAVQQAYQTARDRAANSESILQDAFEQPQPDQRASIRQAKADALVRRWKDTGFTRGRANPKRAPSTFAAGEYGEVLTGQRGLSADDLRAMYEDLVAAIAYMRDNKMGSSLSMYQLLRDLAKLAWHMKSRGITPWSTSKAKSAGDFATVRSAAECSGGYSKQIKQLVEWLKSFIWSSDSDSSGDSRLRRRERDEGLRVWSVRGEGDLEGGL